MNHAIRRMGVVVMVLMLALLININIQQVLLAESTRDRPGNQRTVLQEYSRERGPIMIGADPVAKSVPSTGQYKFQREYTDGPQNVPATGFYSALYGATGIERTENGVLAGTGDMFLMSRIQQLITGRAAKGGAVQLTLNSQAQQAAYSGLGSKVGSVTAIEPATGAILALASTPSFDPNRLASHNLGEVQKYYQKVSSDPNKPMLNRPLAQTVPPGSTFKLVTAAAALESGKYTPSTKLPGPASMRLPQSDSRLPNWNGQACGSGNKVSLSDALAISCNTAFAYLGMELGNDALNEQAAKFGFGTSFQVPMQAATSRYPTGIDNAQQAMSAIGQFDVQATTMQMAQVGAAIGNGGSTMSPYLVKSLLGPDLRVMKTTAPNQHAQALTQEHAAQEMAMMVNVVNNGTGTNAQIPGVAVGGKTGTAETGKGRPNIAWFVAVAPASAPRVAVAVAIENSGGAQEVSGNGLAAPIARDVIQAILQGNN